MKITVAIEIDADRIRSFTDEYLAGLHHVAQLNPAPMEDLEAGRIADLIKNEIVRRWLKDAPVEMYHHSEHQAYWVALTKHCFWDGRQWVPKQQEPPPA